MAWLLAVLSPLAAQADRLGPAQGLSPLLDPQGAIHPAWRVVGFPQSRQPIPLTRFEPGSAAPVSPVASSARQPTAVQVRTDASYGTLVHAWQGPAPAWLNWRWRLDQPLSGGPTRPDLTTKAGDDAALKLCVMFNHPLDRVPLVERTLLRLARSLSGENLPAATVCYVWDSAHPAGLRGANPYTRRVRYISLRGSDSPLGQWVDERRSPEQDFLSLFGDEASGPVAPPVLSVALGADSDNTASTSIGWVQGIQWSQQK